MKNEHQEIKNEIVLYQSGDFGERIEVRLHEDSVWLNRQQMALLFGRDIKTIGKHINNVFTEDELKIKKRFNCRIFCDSSRRRRQKGGTPY